MVQRLVHRDGRWFDEPDKFKPERWDNDLVKRLPRCAYFPFGDGPRICIGNHFAMMEAVLLLATIARRFRLEIEPGQTLELLPSITLRPRHPIHVRLRANQRAVTQSPDTSRVPEPVTDDLSSINPKVGLGLAPGLHPRLYDLSPRRRSEAAHAKRKFPAP
jgi:Cytochrome P450